MVCIKYSILFGSQQAHIYLAYPSLSNPNFYTHYFKDPQFLTLCSPLIPQPRKPCRILICNPHLSPERFSGPTLLLADFILLIRSLKWLESFWPTCTSTPVLHAEATLLTGPSGMALTTTIKMSLLISTLFLTLLL